jgi:hypothetical protein
MPAALSKRQVSINGKPKKMAAKNKFSRTKNACA